VTDLERSRRFYDAALQPLGLVRTVDFQGRGSDYAAMAGQYGVEFTITVEIRVLPLSALRVCLRASNRSDEIPRPIKVDVRVISATNGIFRRPSRCARFARTFIIAWPYFRTDAAASNSVRYADHLGASLNAAALSQVTRRMTDSSTTIPSERRALL
jgi:hypothetical protein